jgi:predicted dehydrogenase
MPQSARSPSARPRYAIVGAGGRSYLYLQALSREHADAGELVALCDSNPGRLARAAGYAAEAGAQVATYGADDFARMLDEAAAERVIVTSPDYTHARYIVAGLEAGRDVVTEKPLTVDAESCRLIAAARASSGRALTVTFNYRYSPPRTLVKQALMSGIIGRVTAVNFEWQLDTHHGADYFRRWHRNKANSGGLLVHKATHHFDLLNWWLGSTVTRVRATGERVFYRPETADALGLTPRGERCTGCPTFDRCRVRLDLSRSRALSGLYAENEGHDGYFRDRCVFSPDIDIEDTMAAALTYANGAVVNYLLTANNPREGYRAVFHGERGLITLETTERSYVREDGALVRPALPETSRVVVQPLFSPPYELAIPAAVGDHGGGDAVMLQHLFGEIAGDPFERAADELAGVWAAMVGIGASASIAAGGAEIELAALAGDIPRPAPRAPPFGPAQQWTQFDAADYPFLAGAIREDVTA